MNNLYKRIRAFYLRNKVSDFEYECVWVDINRTNLSVMSVCSFVLAFDFLVLGIISLFVENYSFLGSSALYFVVFALILAVAFFAQKSSGENSKRTLLLLYFFIWILSIYALIRGIYKNEHNNSVAFMVVIFSLPIIFIDKTRRLYTNLAILGLLNSIFVLYFKEKSVAQIDIFYTWIFYILSIVPCFLLTKIRVREFFLRQIIENERDTDQLTGLLNKSAFKREVVKILKKDQKGIFIMLDLDKFKEVNDNYGHMVGDSVLKKTAACIQSVFRCNDIMGRFGGDEFVIFMVGADKREIAEKRCQILLDKLNKTLVKEFAPDETAEVILASIGFALFENDSFDSLFKKADRALYDAKNTGKNKFCGYVNES